MSKALRIFSLAIGVAAIPVYVYDAKLNGRWDSDGLLLAVALLALVILEPPVSLMIRGYFARKKAREEREKQERLLSEQRAREAEVRRKRLEREAAAERLAEEAEREANRRKADETWNQRRQKVNLG